MTAEAKQKIIADLIKKYGDDTLKVLEEFDTVSEYVSTGSISLDRAMETPGVPKGRIIELVGMQGSGKTTIAMSLMAQAQLKGDNCLFVDAEFTFNKEFATEVMGVQEDKTIIVRPSSGEEAIKIMEDFIDTDVVQVIVLDSIPAFNPSEELTKDVNDPSQIGNHARFVNRLMKRIVPRCGAKDILFVAINQPRDTIGPFASQTETGGRALKCWKAVSIKLNAGKKFEEDGEVVGQIVEFKINKNKFGRAYSQGSFTLRFRGAYPGIDNISDMVDLAVEGKIIINNRGWYDYNGLNLRKKDLRDFFMANPEEFEELQKRCFGDG